jgi:hypothetical protein
MWARGAAATRRAGRLARRAARASGEESGSPPDPDLQQRALAALRGVGERAAAGPPAAGPPDLQVRAISVLRGAQSFRLRDVVPAAAAVSLGGSLLVGDEAAMAGARAAARAGDLGFGFSAAGCLFSYHAGAAGALIDAGLILPEKTRLAGASAGSIIAACIASGMPFAEMTALSLEMFADLRENGTRGRLGDVLRRFLTAHLPRGAAERSRGRVFVAVTRPLPRVRGELVSDFVDRDDLIQALMTSCHIPYYLDGAPTTRFRGGLALDGGLADFVPLPPGGAGVRVSPFPARQLSPIYRIGVAPDLHGAEEWPHDWRAMVGWAFEPADEATTQALIARGGADARRWMTAAGLGAEAEAAAAAEAVAGAGEVGVARAAAARAADTGAQAARGRAPLEEVAARERARDAAGEPTPAP